MFLVVGLALASGDQFHEILSRRSRAIGRHSRGEHCSREEITISGKPTLGSICSSEMVRCDGCKKSNLKKCITSKYFMMNLFGDYTDEPDVHGVPIRSMWASLWKNC